MQKLTRDDLMSLEAYSEGRADFRSQVLAHKRPRIIALGPNIMLHFEDRLTIQYQIQEMLRIEKIFERSGIEEELAAYNPLIPDGSNWKATMMIEYADVAERRVKLNQLNGIENQVYVKVGDGEKVLAIADEDLDRANAEKTSAVHFMRFQLPADDVSRLREGADLIMGVEHPLYSYEITVSEDSRQAMLADLD